MRVSFRSCSFSIPAATLCSLLSAPVTDVHAQVEQRIAAPSIVPVQREALEPGRLYVTPPANNGAEPILQMSARGINIRELLQTIGEKTGKKFIISDGVQGRVDIAPRRMAFSEFLNFLSLSGNFTWDRIGTDTIVVVPRPAMNLMFTPAAPRLTPPENFVIPRLPAPFQSRVQPDWRPFEFNGSTIYAVPLQEPAALITNSLAKAKGQR